MPLFVNISKTLEEKAKNKDIGGSTFIENLLEEKNKNKEKGNNLINDAIELIEEEQYDPNGINSNTELSDED
jgi:hypothetical protein